MLVQSAQPMIGLAADLAGGVRVKGSPLKHECRTLSQVRRQREVGENRPRAGTVARNWAILNDMRGGLTPIAREARDATGACNAAVRDRTRKIFINGRRHHGGQFRDAEVGVKWKTKRGW